MLWLIIWTTVAGVAKIASTQSGQEKIKSFKDRAIDKVSDIINFVQGGLEEMKKSNDKKNR